MQLLSVVHMSSLHVGSGKVVLENLVVKTVALNVPGLSGGHFPSSDTWVVRPLRLASWTTVSKLMVMRSFRDWRIPKTLNWPYSQ